MIVAFKRRYEHRDVFDSFRRQPGWRMGNDGNNDKEEEVEGGKWQKGDSSGLVVGVLTLLFVLATLSLPWTLPLLFRHGGPPLHERLGTVQGVSFVGGPGMWTQVELPGLVLLLTKPWEIPLGTEGERRRDSWNDQLCIVATDRCLDIASR